MLLLFVMHWNKQFTHVISVQKWLVPVVSSHPLLNLSPCASNPLKRCRDSLCPSFTHAQLQLLPFFCCFVFLSIFTCNLYCIIQNLGVPYAHADAHTHSPAWLANDLQLTNGTRSVNGSMASMQMYAKQIRYGRKQISICFPPPQPSRHRGLTWCWGGALCRLMRGLDNEWKGLGSWSSLACPSQAQPCGRPGHNSWAAQRRANGPDAPVGKNCFTIWNPCSLGVLCRGGGEARCGLWVTHLPAVSICSNLYVVNKWPDVLNVNCWVPVQAVLALPKSHCFQ